MRTALSSPLPGPAPPRPGRPRTHLRRAALCPRRAPSRQRQRPCPPRGRAAGRAAGRQSRGAHSNSGPRPLAAPPPGPAPAAVTPGGRGARPGCLRRGLGKAVTPRQARGTAAPRLAQSSKSQPSAAPLCSSSAAGPFGGAYRRASLAAALRGDRRPASAFRGPCPDAGCPGTRRPGRAQLGLQPRRAPEERGERPTPSSTSDFRAPRVYTARLQRQHELKTKVRF